MAMWWHTLVSIIQYNQIKFSYLCPRSTVSSLFLIFFFPFSYIFQSDGSSLQILCPLTSRSETKLKGWILNAEEVRCQLPPTLRYQIRVQTGTCLLPILPYFTITRNPVIPVANHSSDLLHMHTGICNSIGHLCFQLPGTLGHSTGLY